MGEWTLWKLVRRFFLYVGIALTVLAVIAVFIVLTKDAQISGGWIGLVGYTSLLFWVTISKSRERWHRPMFWLAVAGLLAVHLLAFVAILRSYPQWRMIWFMPVVIIEVGLFSVILNMLLGHRAR
jgi:hypothetical protein